MRERSGQCFMSTQSISGPISLSGSTLRSNNINQTRLELAGDECVWLDVLGFAVVQVDRTYSLLNRKIHWSDAAPGLLAGGGGLNAALTHCNGDM